MSEYILSFPVRVVHEVKPGEDVGRLEEVIPVEVRVQASSQTEARRMLGDALARLLRLIDRKN